MRKRLANGTAIRALREATGLSGSAFAPKCGVSQGYMSQVELNQKQPSRGVLIQIAAQLGVPLDAISYVTFECEHAHEDAA